MDGKKSQAGSNERLKNFYRAPINYYEITDSCWNKRSCFRFFCVYSRIKMNLYDFRRKDIEVERRAAQA